MSGFNPDETRQVCHEVYDERINQSMIWGQQNHPDGTGSFEQQEDEVLAKFACEHAAKQGTVTWRHILMEEACEAFASTDVDNLRAELIQVAAVAVAWVENIDRNNGKVLGDD